MWLLALGWLTLILKDLEGEPPLFHVQNYGLPWWQTHYLCYRYPRPHYWFNKALDLIQGKK
jgi:hypothetical protein